MTYGDIVKNKKTYEYGVCCYSMFGCSIHTYDEENNCLGKSLGASFDDVKKYWEVCEIPNGYEWDESGLYIRKIK